MLQYNLKKENGFALPRDKTQADALVEDHYETLKNIARAKRRRAGGNQTMLTTDLLHESWMKLRNHGQWHSEQHFIRTAALAMRQVLINSIKAKLTKKRGEGVAHLPYDDIKDCLPEFKESPEDILMINDLLERLGAIKPRLAELVDLRYFSGFTERETADILGVTDRTVRRDWKMAKTWLAVEMRGLEVVETNRV
ncbi:MAG: RNA polymerase subunit sigma [Robiginitomaculum sp.]|nr:MAG: RNA polymerase subunit sigma [Robiginitomaculum sp.]